MFVVTSFATTYSCRELKATRRKEKSDGLIGKRVEQSSPISLHRELSPRIHYCADVEYSLHDYARYFLPNLKAQIVTRNVNLSLCKMERERKRAYIRRSFPVRKPTISCVKRILRKLTRQSRCCTFSGLPSRHLNMNGYD